VSYLWLSVVAVSTHQPQGYYAVTPWIISRDTTRLIEFTTQAFGAAELGRLPGPDGRIEHAEVRIADSVVMMFDAWDGWPDTPAFLRLYVPDCDEAHGRALRAGATSVTAPTSLFFGDRVARVRDALGNLWWLQTHVADVDPADLAGGPRDQTEAEALRSVQQSLDTAMREVLRPGAGTA
jgi:PhnB protein